MPFKFISLEKSTKKNKKYEAKVLNTLTNRINTIQFGFLGYENYTDGHLDEKRKNAYINRHKDKENWTKTGANTAGFWSYNYLWRFKTKKQALNYIKKMLK
jgi:hypothetical protein